MTDSPSKASNSVILRPIRMKFKLKLFKHLKLQSISNNINDLIKMID